MRVSENEEIDFLKMAYEYAVDNSTDPSTQLGAILVKAGIVFSSGANHFPKGVEETPERWERPLKYSYVEHAERNVIYKAAALGYPVAGSTMYCPWFACDNCARAIIQAGVVEVVGLKKPNDITPDHWKDSINIALNMLTEAGIKTRWIDAHVGVRVRFNGELVEM